MKTGVVHGWDGRGNFGDNRWRASNRREIRRVPRCVPQRLWWGRLIGFYIWTNARAQGSQAACHWLSPDRVNEESTEYPCWRLWAQGTHAQHPWHFLCQSAICTVGDLGLSIALKLSVQAFIFSDHASHFVPHGRVIRPRDR